MTTSNTKYFLLILLCFVCTGSGLSAQGIQISATFDPPELLPGEVGEYRLAIEGSRATPKGSIPQPEGLNMQGPSQSSQTQIINGDISQTLTFTWSVSSHNPGHYVVPKYNLTINGSNYTIPAASLTVINPGTSAGSRQRTLDYELVLSLPREEIYVGESVNVSVDLKIAADIEFDRRNVRPPSHESKLFTIEDFVEVNGPVSRIVNSRRINTYSYPTVITPLKSGELPIQFHLPIRVIGKGQQNQRQRNPFFNSPFDSFFDRRNWQQVNLVSSSQPISVLPLPKTGKPADFTNAIGSFTAKMEEPNINTVETGEPITINFSISGQGNFNRINAPRVYGGDSWKIYDPKSNFVKSEQDPFGRTGTMHFEYILIPEKPGNLTTPPISFNFFDPVKKRYEIMDLPSIPITVTSSMQDNRAYYPTAGIKQQNQRSDKDDTPDVPHLLGIHREIGTVYNNTSPLFTRTWFIILQPIILIILISAAAYRRKQIKLQSDSSYARKVKYSKATQSHLNAARNNANTDFAAFFEDAKNAIRSTIARDAKQDAESLTLSDVEKLLSAKNIPPEKTDSIKFFFNTGDALKYGGAAESSLSEQEALSTLEELIEYLSKL